LKASSFKMFAYRVIEQKFMTTIICTKILMED